jgi:predicted nucleotidyltransferase
MGISEAILGEVIQRILSVCRPTRVILFGSAAAGTMNPDSDIDLLLVEKGVSDTRKESVRIRRALRGMGFPFDIIVMDSERYAKTKDYIGGIAYPAEKYGKVLYAAP